MIRKITSCLIVLLFVSCNEEQTPKPRAFFNLEYADVPYRSIGSVLPYEFMVSEHSEIRLKKNKSLDINYPKMKAAIVVTYREVEGNLKELFSEAEQLTFKHVIKADDIQSVQYENTSHRVYGKMYEVSGDAASQIQFHATDSVRHFITGALYFKVKPNYDSILPAVSFLKKDLKKLLETLEWKED